MSYLKDGKAYVTNGTDWLRIDGATNASDLNAGDIIEANTVIGDFTGQGTVPVVTISNELQIKSNSPAPLPNTIELGGSFDVPKPNQVVYVIGYYYGGGALYANDDLTGQSIELLDAQGMTIRSKYKVLAAIEYKETTENPAPKRLRGADLSDMQARVLADPEEVTDITAVNTLAADSDVLNVKYVNATGQMGAEPFDGMNVVVTTYRDGTIKAVKMVK